MRKLIVHSGSLQGIYYLLHLETQIIFSRGLKPCGEVESKVPLMKKSRQTLRVKIIYSPWQPAPFPQWWPFHLEIGKIFFLFWK